MLKQYLDRFAAMEKKANETLSAEPEALIGVNSLPGSEHDQKVPEDAKKPDAEVQQGQPAGATSTEGAVNGGDAKPLNEGKLEVDQPLDNPDQKPMITDDALTAKEANAHLVSLVGDLLKDLDSAKTQKQASCGGEGATHAAAPDQKPAAPKKDEKKEEVKGEEKKASKQTIRLDDETISKIAEAQAMFMAGREAAKKTVKQAGASVSADARSLIKAACVKAAQESGLDPAAADAAAEGAMAAAGIPQDAAAAASDMAAADAATADAAAAEAAAAGAGAEGAGIPEDVTEEELATAIVDLVGSGDLDPDTAKALVEEIAGNDGSAAPTEDQAAEIIAQGLESGEITPEQAQEIATAVEAGAADAAATDAGSAAVDSAEAQGAADAAEAAQDAADEAKGEADAAEAMKEAAAAIRGNALAKIAGHIIEKRNEKAAAAAPQPGSRVMSKVASILKAKVDAKKQAESKVDAQKQAEAKSDASRYEAGFRKKAEEIGVDPVALARYMLARQAK